MFKWNLLLVTTLVAIGILYFSPAHAKKSYLDSVNSTCGTNYDRDLCHIDPSGDGPLNSGGQVFSDSGYDPT